jgi:hypothetical protein
MKRSITFNDMEVNPTYVTFEQAKKLKEKGYPQLNKGLYYTKDKEHCLVGWGFNDRSETSFAQYSAPEHWQVFNWFREKGYYGEIFVDDDKTFGYYITNFVPLGRVSHPLKRGYLTYEEAEEECIEKLIELIENGTEEDL